MKPYKQGKCRGLLSKHHVINTSHVRGTVLRANLSCANNNNNRDRIWEKGALRAKCNFLSLFNLPPLQGSESLGLQTWLVSSLDLLLHRSNVRTPSKPPVPSSESPKRGIKRRFSNVIDAGARPAHTGSERGPQFAASVVGWWKNIRARFGVHSCYSSRDISV